MNIVGMLFLEGGLLDPHVGTIVYVIITFLILLFILPVFLAVHRQIGALVGIALGQRLVEVHAVPRRLAGVQIAVIEPVRVREDRVGLGRVRHVLLQAEVRDRKIEM